MKRYPMYTDRYRDALQGAATIHARQFRKGTTIPYVAHVLAVSSIAMHHGANEDEAIAALLHDSIEDAPPELGADWVRRWIRFRFGDFVLSVVEGCTDADVVPKPAWLQRKEAYIAKLGTQNASVILVSASDKLHNAGAILSDYRRLGDKVFGRFNETAGKEGVLGYYRGLVTAYRNRQFHPELVGELDRTVTQLEHEAGHEGQWPLRRED